jgi:hypothetical protein
MTTPHKPCLIRVATLTGRVVDPFGRSQRETVLAKIHRLSTSAVPPLERLSFWNDRCMGAYGAIVVDAEPEGFQGVLTTFCAGQLQISSVKSTPAVCRNAVSQERSRSNETAFSLQIVHSGRCRIHHAGIQTIGLPGDMLIADRSKRYELAFAEPDQGLVRVSMT